LLEEACNGEGVQLMGIPPEESPAAGPVSDRQWHVGVDGQTFGPADKAALSQWAAEGRLPPHAQVVAVGEQQWVPVSSVAELRDLPFAAPPHPWGAPPPTVDQVAPCPLCAGEVTNTAPSYGIFFGMMEKTILPRLRCARCGTSFRIDDLPEPARSTVARSKRRALIIWVCLNAVALVLIAFLLYRFGFIG
jgi:hypothetical protein